MQKLLLALCVMSVIGGCRKGAQPAVSDSSEAGGVPSGLIELVDVLPADTAAFGYVEFGDTLRDLPPAFIDHRGAFHDLMDMVKRRWGVDPRLASGLGVVFLEIDDEPVLVSNEQAIATTAQDGERAVARLGKLSAVGSPAAIAAWSAALRGKARLRSAQPAWIKSALRHAAGQPLMFSILASRGFDEQALAELPPAARDLTVATFTLSGTGASLSLQARPGRGDALRAALESALALGKQELAKAVTRLSAAGPGSPGALAGVMMKHYGNALLSSLGVTARGEELDVRVAWHPPTLPASVATQGLAERAIAAGEWNVAQLDFGAPVLEYLIAASDVLRAPLDRAALHRELTTSLAALLEIPRIDPLRVVMSTGSNVIVSIHSSIAPGPQPTRRLGDSPWVLQTAPWGLVLSMNTDPAALGADLPPRTGAPLPLLASSEAATGAAFFRWIVDASRAPSAMPFGMPLGTVQLTATDSRIKATVTALAGQGPVLSAALQQLKTTLLTQAEAAYQARAQGTAEDEISSVLQHHLASVISKLATPSSVTADQLTFEKDVPQLKTFALGVGGIGVVVTGVAAIVLHAFMGHMK
ncbi:MAG: hypothetical protein IPI49_23230 [Myxococcales bacterium]|nr:hypothetical protein [Myxococcales bacterium]